MGKLSCVVMVGFLALHLSVILCVIAMGTPEWMTGKLNHTTPENGTLPEEPNKGLWEFCDKPKNCSTLNETAQAAWFKAVQGLHVAGVGFGILGVVITYSMLLTQACKNSAKGSALNTTVQLLSGAALLTSLIIFGVNARHKDTSGDFPAHYVIDYGWSFYVDVVGVALMWLSALMTLREAHHFATRHSGYEDI